MTLVVDASVVAGWLLEDECNAYTESVAGEVAAGARLLAPNLLLWEVTNLLLTAERRGRLKPGVAESQLRKLAMLPCEWETPGTFLRMEELTELGRRQGLTAYDAAYLALARERGAPLATQDEGMRRAAGAAGIPLYSPAGSY